MAAPERRCAAERVVQRRATTGDSRRVPRADNAETARQTPIREKAGSFGQAESAMVNVKAPFAPKRRIVR